MRHTSLNICKFFTKTVYLPFKRSTIVFCTFIIERIWSLSLYSLQTSKFAHVILMNRNISGNIKTLSILHIILRIEKKYWIKMKEEKKLVKRKQKESFSRFQRQELALDGSRRTAFPASFVLVEFNNGKFTRCDGFFRESVQFPATVVTKFLRSARFPRIVVKQPVLRDVQRIIVNGASACHHPVRKSCRKSLWCQNLAIISREHLKIHRLLFGSHFFQ